MLYFVIGLLVAVVLVVLLRNGSGFGLIMVVVVIFLVVLVVIGWVVCIGEVGSGVVWKDIIVNILFGG